MRAPVPVPPGSLQRLTRLFLTQVGHSSAHTIQP
jgi:hypothetical protein